MTNDLQQKKMKKPLKSIVTSLGSMLIILISTTQTSESCGWGPEGEDYRVAFFTSKVLGDEVFQPFYYTAKMINEYVPNFESDKMRNLKLWQAELGEEVTISDLDKMLYGEETENVLTALYDDKLGATFTENTFATALEKAENKSLLEYFVVAKVNEYVNFIGYTGDSDPWGLVEEENAATEPEFEIPSREEIMEEIDEQLAAVNSDFLKQRYAYLQLINCRYSEQKEKGMAIFEKYFNKNNNDIITAWAIFHAAACTSNEVESNYLLSLAFDKCDSKKVRCYYGFNNELLEETVDFTNVPSEKATIYAITGMNYPGREMDLIKKIHSIDAQNPNLRGLIYREISKIEDWLLTPKITGMPSSVNLDVDNNFYGYDDYDYVNDKYVKVKENEPQLYRNEVNWSIDYFNLKNYKSDVAYTEEFRDFLIDLLNKTPETEQQDFLKLAISHLYFITDKPNEALKYNKMVSANNAQTKVQQQINTILLLPLTDDISNENTKNEIAKSLRYLENHLKDFSNPLRTISQLNLYLSKLYYRKGDLITAAFLHQKSNFTAKHEYEGSTYYQMIAFFDRYATINQIEEAITFLDKKTPTDFEKYLLEKYSVSFANYVLNNGYVHGGWGYDENQNFKTEMKSALIDLQGTVAFRQDDLKLALSYFKKLPAGYWETNYEFSEYLSQSPFTKNDVLMNNGGTMTANKAVVVEKLLALKQKAEGENNAEAYFELGNAYYNFTYYGNSWMMFSYGKYIDEQGENSKIGYSSYSFYPNADKYAGVYYDCDKANYFYQKAVSTATDIELEAQAAMMVEYCNKMKSPTNSNEYLKAWSQKYKSTKTYRSSNCSLVKKQ